MDDRKEGYSKQKERAFYEAYEGEEVSDPRVLRLYIETIAGDVQRLLGGASILEIGAGRAQYARMFREEYDAKRVVASDLVWQQLARDKELSFRAGVNLCASDCFSLPFRDGLFDVVFGSLISHRFRNMADVLQEVGRVLKPQGM